MLVSLTPPSSLLAVKLAGDRRLPHHPRRSRRPPRLRSHVSPLPYSTNGGLSSWGSVTYKGSLRVCSSLVEVEDEACELVNGTEISIGEEGEEEGVRAFLYQAVKNNNGTGVLLLSDIFGFEDSNTRDFAYRVACSGYNVIVPDLFRGDPWQKHWPMSKFEEWIARHNRETVEKDISTCAKWMADEFKAAEISKKLGIIGFCYGGGRVIDALARDQTDGVFGLGVCFYGTRIDTELGKDVKAPVLFVSGDSDPLCPVESLSETEKNITSGGGECRVVVFPGRGHGFAHRPESPEEDRDAEEAFAIMRNWLHDRLLAGN